MSAARFVRTGRQVILHTEAAVCSSARQLVASDIFEQVVRDFIAHLRAEDSPLLEVLPPPSEGHSSESQMVNLLRILLGTRLDQIAEAFPRARDLVPKRRRLHLFVEALYNYWRHFDRFLVSHSETGPGGDVFRPYRTFENTVEELTHFVRAVYRDLCENITGTPPRVYRQVPAGCQVGLIAVPRAWPVPMGCYGPLADVPVIRQVWIDPPLIIDPPENKRSGRFRRVAENPLEGVQLDPEEWLCYPAQVGPLVVFVYFHQCFMGLGTALANLFDLASIERVARGPDAVLAYGLPPDAMERFGDDRTVFHDDAGCGLLVGAIPAGDRFGYFGYLKKMALTLHNVAMMKRGRLPFHGAMVRLELRNRAAANILVIGDTATGKSETLEALRRLGRAEIRQMHVVADDMGSIEVAPDGRLLGYGTETGAFIRLDDLQQGYVFGQIDRAILMSPQKTNARVVLPITDLEEVLHGHPVDFLLYANNHEAVDAGHPVLEAFPGAEAALAVFREGAAMAKGTTADRGLVRSYFANVFGPPEYRRLHDEIAERVFHAAERAGVFLGQLRTRLGLEGWEERGPEEAARALFRAVTERAGGA
ncbi:hypothetical protein G3N55_06185 [Dissulfurirhabdus thermomarina]|uniref:Phosphoenolpyruvate carboxykinase n=1 Tax=Dissulfurirhabdus thermomarina TaxID=1765737 RepID=A0A6N9TPR9_DISTH|nr:hypothetical protein [Dissulfurirhabdus thermomarina]NDY42430.1 hypothetical protein [Dissulfurirhabdus thermomarina]NMX24089.1 hypothetical protein [Dissulfurirhabdus thermomarina]